MLTRLKKYGPNPTTHDIIKAIAILAMAIDHIGYYFFPGHLWWRLCGRIAAPLFFFATGYVSSHKFKSNILIYGVLLSLITFFIEDKLFLNILLNFVVIKFVLDHYDPNKTKGGLLLLLFIGLISITAFISPYFEYGCFGVLFAIGARLHAEKNPHGIYWLTATIMAYFAYESLAFAFFIEHKYEITFFMVCLLMLISFYFYQVRSWQIKQPLRTTILFLGRYSLEIYFIHLALLKLQVLSKLSS